MMRCVCSKRVSVDLKAHHNHYTHTPYHHCYFLAYNNRQASDENIRCQVRERALRSLFHKLQSGFVTSLISYNAMQLGIIDNS